MLSDIADELERDLERTGFAGRTVTVKFKVRSNDLDSDYH